MSKREPSLSSGAGDLRAPPPFGVAETSGEHLLPTPTSMEELLDAPGLLDEAPFGDADDEPLPPLTPPPVDRPTDIEATTPPRQTVAPQTPATGGGRWGWIVLLAVVVFVLGGLAAWLLSAALRSTNDAELANASLEPTAPPPAPAPPQVQEEAPSAVPPKQPSSRDDFRSMSFEDRHEYLANTRGEVEVELHVALDLLQAEQSSAPCQTFADALNTIEASDDPQLYGWALDEASAPQGSESACDGLASRLDALRPAETPTPPDSTPPKRTRKRSARRRSSPQPKPPAGTKPAPAAKPSPPSIATKLDDDLRGLGD